MRLEERFHHVLETVATLGSQGILHHSTDQGNLLLSGLIVEVDCTVLGTQLANKAHVPIDDVSANVLIDVLPQVDASDPFHLASFLTGVSEALS